MDGTLQRASGVERYLAFVATGIAVPILAVSVLSAGGEIGRFFEMLGILLSFGMIAWVPVAVLALAPGRWIFGRIRRSLRGTPSVNLAGTALAALAVVAMGAVTAAVPAALLPDRPEGGLAALAAVIFVWGAPGAVLSGVAFYGREDLSGG